MSKKLNLVDLFAGCGGLSLGLENAGFSPIFVNELNNDALESYLINRETKYPLLRDKRFHINNVKDLVTEKNRISQLSKDFLVEHNIDINNGDIDLLVGGPPCQGFSGIGHRRSYSVDKKQLPSNHLFQDMAWIISQLKPKIFLFENVRGLLSARWDKNSEKGGIWKDVLSTFQSLKDYHINYAEVRSMDYGVPQNRPRILLVGVRDDINLSAWEKNPSDIGSIFLPHKSGNSPDLIDLLGDLIDPNYINGGETTHYPVDPLNSIQEKLRTLPNGKVLSSGAQLDEHLYSNHSENVIAKFQEMINSHGVIPVKYRTKKFSQRLLPKTWSNNGPNITATSLPDDYVHFSQPRTLTVREWARLQGFPDWYKFAGKRTTGGIRRAGNPRDGIFDRELPKYTQIGNAVPVTLAEAIGNHFKKVLSAK